MDPVFGSGELRSTKKPYVGLIGLSGGEKQCKYSVIDGMGVFEGDIVVWRPQELLGIAVVRPGARWPNATVIYDIDAGFTDPKRITEAIAHWTAHTKITFKKRTTEKDYVLFRNGGGCSSAVGRMGGVQWLTLGPGCTVGNAIHEIGHAVGLWHEQSREDRDKFVKVVWTNIESAFQHNFDQHITDGDDIGPYDYDSIMHYPKNAFARDPNQPTLITMNGRPIGQRDKLSPGDIAAVAAMYP